MSSPRKSASLPPPAAALRVAVLEDDAMLREDILLPGLADFGFLATGAATAGELYRRMLTQRFDIVVLDIGLPDENGLSVARHLRELPHAPGIVMLTGQRAREAHIRALVDGADAYLAKPVDLEMLAATLHSVARRLAPLRPPGGAPADRWRLDTDGWCLLSPGGAILALTVPERRLLATLVAAQGQPVARDALIAALAQDVYDFDPHRLEMLVHRLRRKATDADPAPLPLLTSRGTGYLFVTQ